MLDFIDIIYVITTASCLLGAALNGLTFLLVNGRNLVESYNQSGSYIREADSLWQTQIALAVWMLLAAIVALVVVANAIFTNGLVVAQFALAALALFSLHFVWVLYLPGITAASRLRLPPKNTGRGRTKDLVRYLSMQWVREAVRTEIDGMNFTAGRDAKRARRFVTVAWAALIGAIALQMGNAFAPHQILGIGVAASCVAAFGFAGASLQATWAAVSSLPITHVGFVPKTIAAEILHQKDVPKAVQRAFQDDDDDRLQDAFEELVDAKKRGTRSRLILAIAGVGAMLITQTLWAIGVLPAYFGATVCCVIAVYFALIGGFQSTRRAIDLWQETGFQSARVFSVGFAKNSAHTLRNYLAPAATGMRRGSELIEQMSPDMFHDQDLFKIAKDDFQRGQRGLQRIELWLNELRATAQKVTSTRRTWFTDGPRKSITSAELLGHIFEAVYSQTASLSDELDLPAIQLRARISILDDLKIRGETWVPEKPRETKQRKPWPSDSDLAAFCAEAEVPPNIMVDTQALWDSLSNLTRNSLEALSSVDFSLQNPCITVACRWFPSQTTAFSVSIRDNGPGIIEEDRQSLFDPFKRSVGKSTSTGVGLYRVSEFMQSFGGTVVFSTSRGDDLLPSYTVFVLHFPSTAFLPALEKNTE